MPQAKAGGPPCARPGWVETPGAVCLPPAALTGPMRWVFPALAGIENGDILVKGADLLDGTPIFDIKPYLPYVDAHPEARGGFTEQTAAYALEVQCPQPLLDKLPENKRAALLGVLKNDPRPAYQHDPDRVYAMDFGGYRVQFQVGESMLTVIDIQK